MVLLMTVDPGAGGQPIIEDADALGAVLRMPPNTHKGLRDKVIMSILYDTGMRVDELVSLRIRDTI